MRDRKDPIIANRKPGYLTQQTLDEARKVRDAILKSGTQSPFRPLDCWLVMVKVEEKFGSGILVQEHSYSKDRESAYVVLRSGPGYRPVIGLVEKNVEKGITVPTDIERGDIVQCLERIVHPVEWSDGKTYHLVEAHRVLFSIRE